MRQGVERTALDQGLDGRAVDRVQVHLFAEVVEVGEASGLGAGLRDGLHGSHAHALDRGQAEPNALAVDGEVAVAQVDVRRGDLDAHAGGLGHVLDDLVGVGAFKGHRGGQELARVVHFEVGGLVGDDRVARRVGLVEAVAGEFEDEFEKLFGLGLRNAVFLRPGDELRTLGVDLLGLLLGDGLDQRQRG